VLIQGPIPGGTKQNHTQTNFGRNQTKDDKSPIISKALIAVKCYTMGITIAAWQ
jgi:hypothetical protein